MICSHPFWNGDFVDGVRAFLDEHNLHEPAIAYGKTKIFIKDPTTVSVNPGACPAHWPLSCSTWKNNARSIYQLLLQKFKLWFVVSWSACAKSIIVPLLLFNAFGEVYGFVRVHSAMSLMRIVPHLAAQGNRNIQRCSQRSRLWQTFGMARSTSGDAKSQGITAKDSPSMAGKELPC